MGPNFSPVKDFGLLTNVIFCHVEKLNLFSSSKLKNFQKKKKRKKEIFRIYFSVAFFQRTMFIGQNVLHFIIL